MGSIEALNNLFIGSLSNNFQNVLNVLSALSGGYVGSFPTEN
ncbi:hypothetical protein C8K36_102234 [Rhodococcus sp. OK519]|nr:hypothetical protein C8K36_102234 [Rhodococcus sp. OK519]